MQTEITPPHSVESEQFLLGVLLYSNDMANDYALILAESDFYVDSHRAIFSAIRSLVNSMKYVDMLTVVEQLRKFGTLDAAGGVAYVTGLQTNIHTTATVDHHATIVIDMSTRRKLMVAADQLKVISSSLELDIAEVTSQAEKMVRCAGETIVESYETIDQISDRIIEAAEFAMDNPAPVGIQSGLREWDKLLGGFGSKGLHIIAARPSMGKTALATQLAMSASAAGKRVAFMSLEMPVDEIVLRMLSTTSKVNSMKIRTGMLTEEHINSLKRANQFMRLLPLSIEAPASLTMSKLRRRCRSIKAKHNKLDMLVVDYLGLIVGDSKDGRVQEVAGISRGLKALAREFDVPVVALAQLNRNLDQRVDKRPMLSDLRDSGSIEQDADTVTFVHREEYYNPDAPERVAELIVAKNRNGPTGTARCYFDKSLTSFDDLDI